MAQSYGNLATSTILAATDEITGLETITQLYGTSVSGISPVTSTTAALTLTLALDGGAPSTVSIPASGNPYTLMASLQAAVRAAGVTTPYTAFTSRYDAKLAQYVLTSGTAGATPAVPASAVTVSGGTAAVPFKLGVANKGMESTAAAPVLTYLVSYRFAFPWEGFGGTVVTVNSSEMVAPTNLVELQTIANARASQIKKELYLQNQTDIVSNGINGPVSL